MWDDFGYDLRSMDDRLDFPYNYDKLDEVFFSSRYDYLFAPLTSGSHNATNDEPVPSKDYHVGGHALSGAEITAFDLFEEALSRCANCAATESAFEYFLLLLFTLPLLLTLSALLLLLAFDDRNHQLLADPDAEDNRRLPYMHAPHGTE